MIRRGLSDETISRLRFLKACGAIPDTDLGVLVKAALDSADSSDRFKVAESLSKRLQLFINAPLYREVYRKELDPGPRQTVQPGPVKPGTPQFEQLKALIGGLSGGKVRNLAE